ncbi:MAG TPA: hypothetical protein VLC09_20030 [Polyangiaceae bacterium]|nr:hypothetical protein [Polyangiaceae bacterium]
MFSTLRSHRLRACLWGLPLAFACNSSSDGDEGTSTDPTLEFLGASSGAADVEADASSIQLGCDGKLSVHVGPRDSVGEFVNYRIRPPKYCGETDPCGYLRVAALDADGQELVHADGSSVDVLLQFATDYADTATQLRVELISSYTFEPVEVDDKPLRTTWDLAITAAEDCSAGLGGGGAGGAGGDGNLGGGGSGP